MAKSNEGDVIVDVEEVYSKTERYVEQNQKSLTLIAVIIIVIFGGYFAYKYLYIGPREAEARELMWKAEYYFEIDSLRKAIDGDELNYGFESIAEDYSGTQTAKLANYYLGVIYLKMADYELAIEYLEQADFGDAMVGPIAMGGIGDCYMQMEYYEEAIKYYNKAANVSDNEIVNPVYLMKAALAHEELGEYAAAIEKYTAIKEQYPNSSQALDAPKYIARVQNR